MEDDFDGGVAEFPTKQVFKGKAYFVAVAINKETKKVERTAFFQDYPDAYGEGAKAQALNLSAAIRQLNLNPKTETMDVRVYMANGADVSIIAKIKDPTTIGSYYWWQEKSEDGGPWVNDGSKKYVNQGERDGNIKWLKDRPSEGVSFAYPQKIKYSTVGKDVIATAEPITKDNYEANLKELQNKMAGKTTVYKFKTNLVFDQGGKETIKGTYEWSVTFDWKKDTVEFGKITWTAKKQCDCSLGLQ